MVAEVKTTTAVEQIQDRIMELSEAEFIELRTWMDERGVWDDWDRQIAEDAAAGRLDFLAEEAREAGEGELLELGEAPESID